MKAVIFILMAVFSYLIGSLNFAVIVSRDVKNDDVRLHGSKNAGLTNMLRVFGKGAAALTLLGDFLKGILTVGTVQILIVLFPELLSETALSLLYTAMLFTVLGHSYPIYFDFRGGKGILTSAACLLIIDWRVFLIVFSVFLITLIFSKMVSLSSISAAITAGITSAYFNYGRESYIISCVILFSIVIFVIVRHHENIKRIIQKKENKLTFKKK